MIHEYEIIIDWSDDDQAFVAEVPELPGCAAHGDTPEAAPSSCGHAIAPLDRHGRGDRQARSSTKGPMTPPGVMSRPTTVSCIEWTSRLAKHGKARG